MMKSKLKLKPGTNRVMNPFAAISVILCSMTLSHCSLQPSSKDHATLYFQNEGSRFASDASGSLNLTGAIGALTAPELNQFKCIGVNIVGEGISSVNGPQFVSGYLEPLINGNSSCSYTGVTSSTVSILQNADLQLEVPTGPKRVVQVIGFADPVFCSQYAGSPMNVTQGFELGHAVIDLFSSQSVTVANTYPAGSGTADPAVDAARKRRFVNCGNGSGPVPAFDPQTVPGLAHWYVADEIILGTPSQWPDKRGGNYLTSSNFANINFSSLNGRKTAVVGGVSAAAIAFTNAAATTNLTNGVTVFALSKLNASGSGSTVRISTSSGLELGADGSSFKFYANLYSISNQVGVPYLPFSTAGTLNDFHIQRAVAGNSASGTGLRYSVGGSAGTPWPVNAAGTLGGVILGDVGNSALFTIAEVLIYERELSAAEQASVAQYLNQKYALAP